MSLFDRWVDIAVASLDLAALANRSEDVIFGVEAGLAVQLPGAYRRVVWTNPESGGISLKVPDRVTGGGFKGSALDESWGWKRANES